MIPSQNKRPYFLAIAGGTASGKSCLTEIFCRRLKPARVSVLLLDSYYRHLPHLTLEQRASQNFDHPDALELELLPIHLAQLSRYESVEIETYDFATHLRTDSVHKVEARPIVIVEGILALYLTQARNYFDLKVFIDSPDQLRLERRLARDVRERGRTHDSVLQQWRETVEPMHAKFCEPTRAYADLIIDGSQIDDNTVDLVLEHLPIELLL